MALGRGSGQEVTYVDWRMGRVNFAVHLPHECYGCPSRCRLTPVERDSRLQPACAGDNSHDGRGIFGVACPNVPALIHDDHCPWLDITFGVEVLRAVRILQHDIAADGDSPGDQDIALELPCIPCTRAPNAWTAGIILPCDSRMGWRPTISLDPVPARAGSVHTIATVTFAPYPGSRSCRRVTAACSHGTVHACAVCDCKGA